MNLQLIDVILTDHLIIRRFIREDFSSVHEILKDDSPLQRFMPFDPHTSKEETQRVFDTVFSKENTYAIEYSGRCIGALFLLPEGEESVTISHFIHSSFFGKGFILEAYEAAIYLAFEKMDVGKIFADVADEDHHNIKLLKALGMKLVSQKENFTARGKTYGALSFSINKDDYFAFGGFKF